MKRTDEPPRFRIYTFDGTMLEWFDCEDDAMPQLVIRPMNQPTVRIDVTRSLHELLVLALKP